MKVIDKRVPLKEKNVGIKPRKSKRLAEEVAIAPEEGEEDDTQVGGQIEKWLTKAATLAGRKTNKSDIIAFYDQLIWDILDSSRYSMSDMTNVIKDSVEAF